MPYITLVYPRENMMSVHSIQLFTCTYHHLILLITNSVNLTINSKIPQFMLCAPNRNISDSTFCVSNDVNVLSVLDKFKL